MLFVYKPHDMNIAAVLIVTFVAVECMPRPDFGPPGIKVPTGVDGKSTSESEVIMSEQGEIEVENEKTSYEKRHNETSTDEAQKYDHTDSSGLSVHQDSETNKTHSETETEEKKEKQKFKVGPKSGVAMSKDESVTKTREEDNTETGKQSFKKSSGDNDPNHKQYYEYDSEYNNSNHSKYEHHEEKHKSFKVRPDLNTESEHAESKTDTHDEEKESEGQTTTKEENYNKDNGKVSYTGSKSQSNYKNKEAKSSSNSTATQEKSSSNGGGNNNENNGTSEGGGNFDVITGTNNQSGQNNEEDSTGDRSGDKNSEITQENGTGGLSNDQSSTTTTTEGQSGDQSNQNNLTGNTKGQSSDQSIINIWGGDTEGESGGQNNQNNLGSDSEGQSNNQISQINQGGSTEGQTVDQSNQMNQSGGADGQSGDQINQDSQKDTGNQTDATMGTQENIEGSQNDGSQAGGCRANGEAEANGGPKFPFEEDVYRELENDEVALGLIKDDGSIKSQRREDISKLNEEYLFSIVDSIRNANLVTDAHGHARFVTPYYNPDESLYSSADFMDMITPYRTLAQKYGASDVSSHYANAKFVESRFDQLFGSTLDVSKLQYPGYIDAENTLYGTDKFQNSIHNLFDIDNAKYDDVLNLQLSPMEWEERERKEAELKNAQHNNHQSTLKQSDVEKVYEIDPAVRDAILSQDLNDILKKAETSTQSEEMERIFAFPIINKENIIVDTPNYETPRNSYDATKDISQVITSKVDLVSSDDGFGSNVVSGNIVENTLDNALFVGFEDIYDNANGRKDKTVNDYFDESSVRVTSDRENITNSSKNENIKYDKTSSNFETTNSGDFLNLTNAENEESSQITSNTPNTMINYGSNDIIEINDELETNKTDTSESSLNESEKDFSIIADANLTDNIDKSQYLANTEKSISKSSLNTTSQDIYEDEPKSIKNYDLEIINDNINKSVDTFQNESEVNSLDWVNEESDIISVGSSTTNNENLNITADAIVNRTSENYDVSKTSEMNKTSMNITELPKAVLSTDTQTVDKQEFKIKNITNFDELYTDKSNANEFQESVLISEVETTEVSDKDTTKAFEKDKKEISEKDSQKVSETDTREVYEKETKEVSRQETKEIFEKDAIDYFERETKDVFGKEIKDSSENETKDVSEKETKDFFEKETREGSDNNNTEKSIYLNKRNLEESDIFIENDSVIINSELETNSDLRSENTSKMAVSVDKSDDAAFELLQITRATDTTKLGNIESSNVSTNYAKDSNFNTTEVNKSVFSENVNITAVADKKDNDMETSTRLFARSALETNEEYNFGNTDTINNSNSNPGDANVDKSVSAVALDSSTYNANDIKSVKEETNVTKITSEITNSTDNRIEKSNSDSFDIKAVDVFGTSDTSNDSKVKSNADTETTVTSIDLNPDKLAPDNEKAPDSAKVDNISHEINISTKETEKSEFKVIDRTSEVKENAGTSDYTSITAADSSSTTNINTDNQTTENRSMGDNNKTTELLTIVESDNSQVKSTKSQTTVETDKFLESAKSDRDKEESKREVQESTSKSDESRSISAERLIFSSGLDSLISTDSASTSAE